MPNYPLSDGSFLFLPDGLDDDEIFRRIQDVETKFKTPTVEEETVATTPVEEETTLPPYNPYENVAPKLRPPEFYDEGDSIGQQFEAGFEQEALADIDKVNIYENLLEEEQLTNEYNALLDKEKNQTLDSDEVKRKQDLHIMLYGTGKSGQIQEMFPGQPISPQMYETDEKAEKGLIQFNKDTLNTFDTLQKSIDEVEVSDAFKWIAEQGQDSLRDGFGAFMSDLTFSQKLDFMGDLLGRSGSASSQILATSFGVGAALRSTGALTKFGGQVLGTGGVSGEIEYSHSMHEYLRANGLDMTDPESIKRIMSNDELLAEANQYALTRGATIGFIDGVTGGIATRIIAPSVITSANRSIMPFVKGPIGTAVNPVVRQSYNLVAQTPLQMGLPGGAEYFAQLATLEEGERVNMADVFFEIAGEAAFVPADIVLGGISANQEIKSLTAAKEENFNRAVEQVQIVKEQAKQIGLGEIAGEVQTADGNRIYDTGIPFFNEAFKTYQENQGKINTFADTDNDVVAPNQFFVQPDGQGNFAIIDTYQEVIGNTFNTQEEAAGISGVLNLISGANYSNELKSNFATMQGLSADSETNPFVSKLGNAVLNPYFGQIDIRDVEESPNVNSAAYERLINAVGREATGIDILSLQGVLPQADINRLLDVKAKRLYEEAGFTQNIPTNVTVKMLENLGKKLNVNIDTKSNGFKSLSLRLTGEANFNKLNGQQKRLVYSFLNTLPAHEGNIISLPDFSPRPYTLNEYNQVVEVLNTGSTPTIPNIVKALGLNPNNLADKRVATRLRQDLVSAGIVDQKGSKYKFNANGEWTLNSIEQSKIQNDPTAKQELKDIQKFRNLLGTAFEKMNLPEISVRLDKAIQTRVGQANPDAEGQFDPIWSEVFLSVAKAKEGTTTEQEVLNNLSKTMGHELFHAAVFLDLFSPQERANLDNYVRNNQLNNKTAIEVLGKEQLNILKTELGRMPTYLEAVEFRYNALDNQNLNSVDLLEEANALLFEDYIENKKLSGKPRSLMERTKKFFTSINNGLNELGYQTYEDVFDKLLGGEIGTRERYGDVKQSVEITGVDEFGAPTRNYEVQTPVVRTNRILVSEFADLLRVTETSIGNEYFPDAADRASPDYKRPLQDAPNLKFKLANVQQRPTTLTMEFIKGAINEEYGNDINQIAQNIFGRNIINNPNVVRRLGRSVENLEVGVTQSQLFHSTQNTLKKKGYPDTFPVYVVGDIAKGTSTVATNNLEEATRIANEFVSTPFEIFGDSKQITEYTIDKEKVMLDKDIMFGLRPPAFAQPSLPATDYLLVGSNALIAAPKREITYQAETPPQPVPRRKLDLGPLKPKYKMSPNEFMTRKGTRGKQITDNLRVYGRPSIMEGQATLEERKLSKKLKLSTPLDDIAFTNAKKDLLELMNKGVDILDLADHPASLEGMNRMSELETTKNKYINLYGEQWFLNDTYIRTRDFIINNKRVKGLPKATKFLMDVAESYSPTPVPNNRQAYILLGPPASGKSFFAEEIAKNYKLAIVDSDDAKKIIPEYAGGVGANATHDEASMLANNVRRDLINEGKNILLPRVGGYGKRKKIQETIDELKENGYNVKTVLVDVDYRIALGRMYERFAKTGRLVPPTYLEDVKNTPIDTFHRVKYVTDGFAWIDNNGGKNQQVIRQDTGILPSSLFGGRESQVRRILRESSQIAEQEAVLSEVVDLQEAIEGAKGINERLINNGLTPKFNLNASPDAIRAAYIQELKDPESIILKDVLNPKYSFKNSGKKLDDKTERLVQKLTIRDDFDDAPSMGSIILRTAKGYMTEDAIREQLVDRYARFNTVGIQAARARGIKEEMLTADVSGISALLFSDRSGEVFRAAFAEGIPVYDEKGYVRVETVSPIDGKAVAPPMEFLTPAFLNPQLMWAFQAVRIAKRETRFDKEGKPVKTTAQDRKDAAQALNDYPELKEMSEAYDRWDQHVVKFLVDTGVLDEKTAQKWTAHADYFPFYRMMGRDQDGNILTKGPQIFKGMTMRRNIFVRAKGSEDKDIVDPISGIADNLRAAITLGMKNIAANRVVRDMVDAGFAQQVPLNASGNNIVNIRVGGKNKSFAVDDVDLYEAFQNFEGGPITFGGAFSRFTAAPKELLSALITRTPDFWIRQILRDSISAQTILGGNFIPLATSLKNWTRVWSGMIANRLPFTDKDYIPEGVTQMRRAGIVSGYDAVVREIDDSQKLIKAAYKKAGINNRNTLQTIAGAPIDIVLGLWELIGEGTISSDAATRLAVYEDVLEKTGNEAEAVFMAMEVLNFTRRGKNPVMQYLATVIPFQNPRLQGVDVFYRGATGAYGQPQTSKQARRRAFALRMGMLASLTPLMYIFMKDSEPFEEASEEQRDNYYILPFKVGGEVIAIPIPFEVGLLTYTIPMRILRYFDEKETGSQVTKGVLRRIGQSLAIDPRQATILNAPLEVMTGYDFYTGRPIVPPNMQNLDKELQYRANTNNLWKELSEETGGIISPLEIDNLWRGYTGTIGAWIANATDAYSREFLDMPDRPVSRLDEKPAVGALLLPKEGRGQENDFYLLKETADNLLSSMKTNQDRMLKEGDQFALNLTEQYRTEYMQELKSLTQDLNNINETLRETYLEERRIMNSDLSGERKTERITELQDLRNFILEGINDRRMKLEKGLFEDIRQARQ